MTRVLSKQIGSVCPVSNTKSLAPFNLVHTDVSPVFSVSCYKWFVTFIDDCSKVTWIYLLTQKSDVSNCFKDFLKWLELNLMQRLRF